MDKCVGPETAAIKGHLFFICTNPVKNGGPCMNANGRRWSVVASMRAWYPNEYQSYYLPTNEGDAEDKITSGKCFMAYLETIHWLLNNGEDEELLLLLYRGSHFLSLFYEMRYHHFLDALKMMMQYQIKYLWKTSIRVAIGGHG